MNIPFLSFDPMNKAVKAQILASFEAFFDKSWYVLGDQVKAFEQEYAQYNHNRVRKLHSNQNYRKRSLHGFGILYR